MELVNMPDTYAAHAAAQTGSTHAKERVLVSESHTFKSEALDFKVESHSSASEGDVPVHQTQLQPNWQYYHNQPRASANFQRTLNSTAKSMQALGTSATANTTTEIVTKVDTTSSTQLSTTTLFISQYCKQQIETLKLAQKLHQLPYPDTDISGLDLEADQISDFSVQGSVRIISWRTYPLSFIFL
jgi:hypothetical protein